MDSNKFLAGDKFMSGINLGLDIVFRDYLLKTKKKIQDILIEMN